MKTAHLTSVVLCIFLISTSPLTSRADDFLEVHGVWARATVEGMRISGAFLKLFNSGSYDVRLVGATSEVANAVEIHVMTKDGEGVMRMRPVEGGILVPANSEVEFTPGATHLMLIGLHRPLVAGEKLPLSLYFEGDETVQVEIEVREINPDDMGHHH